MPSPLLVVLGPTGTGKSELGLVLARKFGGEIIGCDSVQVYRGLDVGSAKTSIEQRFGIQHYLLDIIDPSEYLTAGAYSRLARDAISAVRVKNKIPVVVGGTGFYLRALLEGLSPAPARNNEVRARLSHLESRRPGALHRLLRCRDPRAADRIHPNDRQKLIRAVELILLARQSVSALHGIQRESMQGFVVLKLGLTPDRSLLHQRLNLRSEWMFSNGLLAETKALLDSGISPDAKPLQTLGYKQAVKVLTRQFPLGEAIRECQIKTRQYAKRQMTWFRREAGVHWLSGFGREPAIQQEALEVADRFLASLQASSRLPG